MTLELRHREARNAVGIVDHRLLILARNGTLTTPALTQIEEDIASAAAAGRTPLGCLVLVMPEAGMSDAALLARQRRMMRTMLADESVSLALVTEGDSIQTSMIRSFIRAGAMGKRNVKVCAGLDEATPWLASRLSMSVEAVGRAAQTLMRDL